jgi:hypothetical protein
LFSRQVKWWSEKNIGGGWNDIKRKSLKKGKLPKTLKRKNVPSDPLHLLDRDWSSGLNSSELSKTVCAATHSVAVRIVYPFIYEQFSLKK